MDAPCCVGIVRKADGLKGKDTSIGKKQLKGYYTAPDVNNGTRMGVVVVHDIFGMGIPNTKYVVDHFASKGFHAVAPDFYAGKGLELDSWPADEFEIKEELSGDKFTNWFGAITAEEFWDKYKADVDDSTAFLRRKGCGKFAIIGFCWGGKAAEVAAKGGRFNAGISCHGCMHTKETYAEATCPMLYISVTGDSFFPASAQDEIKAAGGAVKVYEGLDHGFMVRGDFANNTKVNDAANEAFDMAVAHMKKACLRKPKYVKVESLKPTSRGFNVIIKVAEEPKAVEASGSTFTEVLCGDESGAFLLSMKDSQKEGIAKDTVLTLRNASVRMVEGHIRVVVDKWGKLDLSPPEKAPEEVKTSNNLSATEYELAAA